MPKQFDRGFGQLQAVGRVINRAHVELIVSVRELVISQSKRAVALDCLFEQTDRFKKFAPRTENRSLDQVAPAQIKIVGREIACRFFFDRRFLARRKF